MEGVSKNPLENIYYHTAFFSRRWFSKINRYPPNDPRVPDTEKFVKTRERDRDRDTPDYEPKYLKDQFQFSVNPLPRHSNSKFQIGVSALEFYSLGAIKGALAPETAWMFISELASSRTDIKRFEKRRGLPILRENWAVPEGNHDRSHDRYVIDSILDNERFFCNFWIHNYWYIESNSEVKNLLRKIFIEIDTPTKYDVEQAKAILYQINPTVDKLRQEFLNILINIKKI